MEDHIFSTDSEHEKFVLPNVKQNSNIFIQQIQHSHEQFHAVLDEISSKVLPYSDFKQDTEHEIQTL